MGRGLAMMVSSWPATNGQALVSPPMPGCGLFPEGARSVCVCVCVCVCVSSTVFWFLCHRCSHKNAIRYSLNLKSPTCQPIFLSRSPC